MYVDLGPWANSEPFTTYRRPMLSVYKILLRDAHSC